MSLYRTITGTPTGTVTVLGVPVGYTARIGTATVVAGATSAVVFHAWTGQLLEVLNERGDVVDSDTPVADGDTYLYVPALVEWLYDRIPELTRERDATGGGALYQLVQVLGSGLQGVKDHVAYILDYVDPDHCPTDYLPALGAMLGFEFPYDLDEKLQRNFIRSIIAVYRIKGTPNAMKYMVGRLIAGQGITLDIQNEDHVAKTFDFILTMDEANALGAVLMDRITYLVNLYAPAGMIPNRVVSTYGIEAGHGGASDALQGTTTETTPWRLNRGHTLNTQTPYGYTVSVNNAGVAPLAI
jgi:phage tail-like protein